MGMVYLPTWMVDFKGKLVAKYTIHGFFMGHHLQHIMFRGSMIIFGLG